MDPCAEESESIDDPAIRGNCEWFDKDDVSLIMPLIGSLAFKLTYASEPS